MGYSAQRCETVKTVAGIMNIALFSSRNQDLHQRHCLVFSLFNEEALMWFHLETHATFLSFKTNFKPTPQNFFFIFALVLTEGLSYLTLNVIRHFNSILEQSCCELMGKICLQLHLIKDA